jgi:hypothetical protein
MLLIVKMGITFCICVGMIAWAAENEELKKRISPELNNWFHRASIARWLQGTEIHALRMVRV